VGRRHHSQAGRIFRQKNDPDDLNSIFWRTVPASRADGSRRDVQGAAFKVLPAPTADRGPREGNTTVLRPGQIPIQRRELAHSNEIRVHHLSATTKNNRGLHSSGDSTSSRLPYACVFSDADPDHLPETVTTSPWHMPHAPRIPEDACAQFTVLSRLK